MSKRCILHLVGSPTDQFHCDLSRFYAKSCIEALADDRRYHIIIAYVSPDNIWRFPKSLSDADIAASKSLNLVQALQFLTRQPIDIALPQMFCQAGMSEYRAMLELLEIPYIGNTPDLMALTADKAKAKAIVAAAGVAVPESELLRRGDTPRLIPPVVVKPNKADNSIGVTLVTDKVNYTAALKMAFEQSDEVLVERYIELGREVRAGIIAQQGALICLPLEEYQMDAKNSPIRAYNNKLSEDEHGQIAFASNEHKKTWLVDAQDPAVAQVWAAAKLSHQALGCRHYSLFDFRIDPQGKPWFLEAGLYCSFAPKSVVVTMAEGAGIELTAFFAQMLDEVLNVT